MPRHLFNLILEIYRDSSDINSRRPARLSTYVQTRNLFFFCFFHAMLRGAYRRRAMIARPAMISRYRDNDHGGCATDVIYTRNSSRGCSNRGPICRDCCSRCTPSNCRLARRWDHIRVYPDFLDWAQVPVYRFPPLRPRHFSV